jgi:hypothetical protein
VTLLSKSSNKSSDKSSKKSTSTKTKRHYHRTFTNTVTCPDSTSTSTYTVGDSVACLTAEDAFVKGWVSVPNPTVGPHTGYYEDPDGQGVLRSCWSPCQILTVYVDGGSSDGDVMVEVRWLYQDNEIPGVKKARETDWGLEEVYETDHVDVVPAESVLGNVFLTGKMPKTEEEVSHPE